MTTDILVYLAAFGGGFLGAAFGALFAFSFVGITLLAGIAIAISTGDASWISLISFGPFFGPHISFAGGVGAAAYAYRRGYLSGVRDIATPLVSLAKPDVLLVGGLFGVGGLIVHDIVSIIPWLGTHTDLPGITVVISGIAARLIFGKTGIIGTNSEGLHSVRQSSRPNDKDCWVRYQEGWGNAAILSLGVGLLSAWATVAAHSGIPGGGGQRRPAWFRRFGDIVGLPDSRRRGAGHPPHDADRGAGCRQLPHDHRQPARCGADRHLLRDHLGAGR